MNELTIENIVKMNNKGKKKPLIMIRIDQK